MSAELDTTSTAARGQRPAEPSTARRSAFWLVTARELQVKIRDRNFLISTAVLMVLLVLSLAAQVFFAGRSDTVDVAVVSPAGQQTVSRAGAAAETAGTTVKFQAKQYASVAQAEQAVRNGDVDAAVLPSGDTLRLVGLSDQDTDVATWIGATIQQQAIDQRARAAGTTLAALSAGTTPAYDLLTPGASDDRNTARISGAVFGILFYIAVLIAGAALAQSVVEEKQNRVVEILAAAIPVRQLLIGKVLAATILAMAQVVLLAAIGVIGLLATGNSSMLSAMTRGIVWFIVFFLIGFVALACLWAVVGSVASRSEDIQSTSPPMTVLVLGIFLIGILARGTVQTVASYVPLLSTITMPTRVISGDATWVEALISVAISVVCAYGIIRLAARMYRNSLLQTHGRMSFRQAL